MLVGERLTGNGGPVVLGRLILTVSAFGCLLLIMRRWWRQTVGARLEPLAEILSTAGAGHHPNEPRLAGRDEISRLADLVQRVRPELRPDREIRCGACHASAAPAPDLRLSADLKLAADHVESIRTLIEVSEAHRQPVPRAAFQNLELVSKHLRGIERQLEAGPEAAHAE